jgi:hypothetical protein
MLLVVATVSAQAQVTIGAATDPAPFSVLELISAGSRGLRLPQLSASDKATAFGNDNENLGSQSDAT